MMRAGLFLALLIVSLVNSQSVDPYQHTGYINVNAEYDSNLFYWFFPAINNNQSAR
eukprot:TRINITY_DN11302_c0_g1_i1.p1 TRINITY_DN11302_c0_g1~~TRINITY_DN11302_c0_g1_i1.p1  ORF type:complete len:56 (-),score=15.77 TRINITY_DN11302_c0_g1_i1:2-169(-)